MKILMVCLGNICRSPLAEGIMRSKIEQNDLDWIVDSAGTSGHHQGDTPDQRSIDVAQANGLDISEQRSRKLTVKDLDNFDLVCVMDSSNYINIRMLSSNSANLKKIQLIMNFVKPEKNINVTDPYYGDEGFDLVYKMLDEACEAIVKKYASS